MHLLEVIDANHDEVGELTQSANENSFVQHATCNVQVNHSAETQCSAAVERVIDNASVTDIVVKTTDDNAKHDFTVDRTVDKARHNVAVERVADFTKDGCVSHGDTDEPQTVSTLFKGNSRESISLEHSKSSGLEQGSVKTDKSFSRPSRSSPGGMFLRINGKGIKAGSTMINVPLGCNKFSMLQARHSRTSPQKRHEDLRSVHAEYRPRIAPIRYG